MIVRVFTPETGFCQDMADVVRLFYGGETVLFNEPGAADLAIEHTVRRENGAWLDVFSGGGASVSRAQERDGGDALEKKRLRKRAVKLALYALLKRLTGVRPPWGSLTGIRPSRLYYEALAEGLDPVRTLTDVFDVTPERARLLDQMWQMQDGLRQPPAGSFDVYVGIPFCKTRCAYCSFPSGEIGNGKLVAPYVAALEREIALCAQMLREKGLRARAVYIGGGTPTSIPRDALCRVLRAVGEAFPTAVELTVEAGRPDTIDAPTLAMLRSMGATRISVNPQTFCDETLRRIGRAHTSQQTQQAFLLAREAGFDDINMDLIAALPGETLEDFRRSLEKTAALAPESVTVHALAVKRSSRLHEALHVQGGGHGLTPAGEAEKMTGLARALLCAQGYRPYYLYRQKYMAGNLENVGYAKPGRACLYNIGNMEETASVLALGAGAISKWLFDRARRIERAPNVKNIEAYIDRVDEMVERKRALIFS